LESPAIALHPLGRTAGALGTRLFLFADTSARRADSSRGEVGESAQACCGRHARRYTAAMPYKDITPPAGEKITREQTLNVPDRPIIPFIRGDGTGPDIWAASERVLDAAVEKAYGGKKKIAWFEVFAGQSAKDKFDNWLPDDTVAAFREYLVGIKGPLTTPVEIGRAHV